MNNWLRKAAVEPNVPTAIVGMVEIIGRTNLGRQPRFMLVKMVPIFLLQAAQYPPRQKIVLFTVPTEKRDLKINQVWFTVRAIENIFPLVGVHIRDTTGMDCIEQRLQATEKFSPRREFRLQIIPGNEFMNISGCSNFTHKAGHPFKPIQRLENRDFMPGNDGAKPLHGNTKQRKGSLELNHRLPGNGTVVIGISRNANGRIALLVQTRSRKKVMLKKSDKFKSAPHYPHALRQMTISQCKK